MTRTTIQAWQVHLGGMAVMAVLTALAFMLVVAPIRHAAAERDAMRSAAATSREKADSLDQTRRRFETDLEQARRQLDSEAVALKPANHLNRRLAQLTALLESSGLTIRRTDVENVETGPLYQTVRIRVGGTGSYPTCASVLHRLHGEVADAAVTAFEVSGNPAVPATPARFQFDLEWYAAPAVAAVPE